MGRLYQYDESDKPVQRNSVWREITDEFYLSRLNKIRDEIKSERGSGSREVNWRDVIIRILDVIDGRHTIRNEAEEMIARIRAAVREDVGEIVAEKLRGIAIANGGNLPERYEEPQEYDDDWIDNLLNGGESE